MSLPIISMINSSCMYKKVDPNVVTFYNDQIIIQETMEFPHGTITVCTINSYDQLSVYVISVSFTSSLFKLLHSIQTSRCVDVGKFRLEGAVRRKCLSGQWMGLSSKCEGLSQVHDYAREFQLSVTL
jgi:hypothetical protein